MDWWLYWRLFGRYSTSVRSGILSQHYLAMEIYLVRHTTPKIQKGICYGQSDLDLADTWTIEFKKLKLMLPDQVDKVFSSPLKRCTRFANELNGHITLDERLKELDFGDWELKKWDNIPDDELFSWMNDFTNVAPKNGERFQDFFNRINVR